MAGKFIVRRMDGGKFHFVLTATNGRTVLASEVYESKRAALKGVEAIQRLAGSATVVDETGDRRTAAARAARSTSSEAAAPVTRTAAATKASKATKATNATSATKAAKATKRATTGTSRTAAATSGTTSASDGRRRRVAKR
jgi:uncharacterized protein YegP (UPF0339 family)